MKKCRPGVICVENVTLFLFFFVLLVLFYLIYLNNSKNIIVKDINNVTVNNDNLSKGWFTRFPSWPYTNFPKDVLLDPYVPPYRDERYFINANTSTIPLSTNIGIVDTSYRQMGIITPLNGTSKDNILPLMGRPLFVNKNKWQYYTISNQHNNVKLPISFKGRSALNDYGVDQIFNGDTIYVEGYNEPFKVTIYENDTIKYLPFV